MQKHSRDLSIGEALDIGAALAMKGNHRNACTLFRGVLIHEPENFEALSRLGVSLFELGEYYEALYRFERALKINRRHPMALTNHGLCLAQLGHWEEGLPELERATIIADKIGASASSRALAYNNLGNTLERINRHADALVALDKGIALNPADPFPHYNRGIALLRLNRHREAIDALNRSLSLGDPAEDTAIRLNDADGHYNRGMGHLLLGEFKEGFADYEYRLLTSEHDKVAGDKNAPNLGLDPALKWNLGNSLTDKTVLVHCEQGLGDTIQFLRFLPILRDRSGPKQILLIAHAGVRPLIDIPGVTVLQPGEDITGKFDCWVALMSLPLYLGVEREDQIPHPLRPRIEIERVEQWGRMLGNMRHPLRVGVCWAGNFQHKNDSHRSIAFKTFAALFDVQVEFVSLQQMRPGETHDFAALQKRHDNLSAFYLDDFRDTAAVMLNLDLVVSVDTAVAHMAATMGVPTWILLPSYSTDWRWMLDRSDSPWYPSVTLYRQPQIGDWRSVLDRIKGDLTSMAAQRVAA